MRIVNTTLKEPNKEESHMLLYIKTLIHN